MRAAVSKEQHMTWWIRMCCRMDSNGLIYGHMGNHMNVVNVLGRSVTCGIQHDFPQGHNFDPMHSIMTTQQQQTAEAESKHTAHDRQTLEDYRKK